jgi:hypothetical protein
MDHRLETAAARRPVAEYAILVGAARCPPAGGLAMAAARRPLTDERAGAPVSGGAGAAVVVSRAQSSQSVAKISCDSMPPATVRAVKPFCRRMRVA